MKYIAKMKYHRMFGLQRAHRTSDKETKAQRGRLCSESDSELEAELGFQGCPR